MSATSPDARHQILEARAQALARAPEAEESGRTVEMAVLIAGGQRFGVALGYVQEIQPLRSLTPIPGTPPHWRGLINLRGQLYPVLDLAMYLGLRGPEADPRREGPAGGAGLAVLVRGADLAVALLALEVAEVRRIPAQEILPSLSEALGAVGHWVQGVTPDLITVLDVEAMLADPRLAVEDK